MVQKCTISAVTLVEPLDDAELTETREDEEKAPLTAVDATVLGRKIVSTDGNAKTEQGRRDPLDRQGVDCSGPSFR